MKKQRELEEEIQHLKQVNSAFKVSRCAIRRAMRLGNLMQQRHSYPNELTKQDIRVQKSENIIKKDFTAIDPNCKWLTDITVECKDGKLHINPVLECYNGEIIGLAMDDNMKATLRCNAIDNAYKETGAKKELLYIVMLVANIQVEYIEKHLVSILKLKA